MPFRYIEDELMADVAFAVENTDLAMVFQEAGDAVIKTMIENPESIRPLVTRSVTLDNEQLDLLLYNFLEQFLYYKDAEQLLLKAKTVSVQHTDDSWHLSASLTGENLDPSRHLQVVDVKAVTLHDLSLLQLQETWHAHVVLDV
jgi:SHS2 domain-containing protein